MGDFLTFDVIDRPAGGALHAHRTLRRTARPAGCRALITGTTNRFAASLVSPPTPRRIAVVAAWEDEAAADRSPVPALAIGAREHWHVRGPVAKVTEREPWSGWAPSAEGAEPLRDDDPLLVLISGELHGRTWPGFLKDAVGATMHAAGHPGYLGGLGMYASPTNTTSCSAWRSVAASRDYAYGPGGHRTSMLSDVKAERHHTNRFLRVRPIASSGTLDGRDPFAGLLSPAAPALRG